MKAEVRWQDIYRRLCHEEGRGLLPAQVDELTIGELELLLWPEDDKTPEGFVPMSPAEMVEHARRVRGRSARERLEAARRG